MSGSNFVEREGVLYDENGSVVSVAYKSFSAQRVKDAIAREKEENYRLSAEDTEKLGKYPHALDYEFSEDQIRFLEDNGYLVINNFFSDAMVDKMVDQIFVRAKQLAGLERDNISTWETSGVNQGFLDLWHLPAYYEMRQDPRLYSVFAQILNDPKLTVSLDRVSIKTPAWLEVEENGEKKKLDFPSNHRALQIHTDLNLWYLNCPSFQGSICLSDCPVGSGGFTCMPGYHKLNKIRPYHVNYELGGFQGAYGQVRRSPPDEESVFECYEDKEAIARDLKEIPMKKGDFLIWSSRLPHGNAKNSSNRWRLQCFVRHVSSTEDKKQIYRKDVSESVQTGMKPLYFSSGSTTTPYYRDWEVPYHQPVPTTDLGKKLFGFESWDKSV